MYLVSGASGFLGEALLNRPSPKCHAVRWTGTKFEWLFDGQRANALNHTDWTFVHLIGAGRPSKRGTICRTNEHITQRAIEFCLDNDVRKLVYVSGYNVRPGSGSEYIESKWRCERAIINSGLKYKILRPSYIIGKGDEFCSLERNDGVVEIVLPRISPEYIFRPLSVQRFWRNALRLIEAGPDHSATHEIVGDPVRIIRFFELLEQKGRGSIKLKFYDVCELIYQCMTDDAYYFSLDELALFLIEELPLKQDIDKNAESSVNEVIAEYLDGAIEK